jgi:signal transduction histidine kinase
MIWWHVLAGALLSGPLWVMGTLWVARRLWRAARRLSARARGLEHLVELGHLVGGLAHEIKNPLSTINVNLKLLAEDLARFSDDHHARLLRRLRSVQDEADRVRGVLEDILRFAGKYELSLATTDIRQLVGELVDFFRPQAEAAKVILRTSMADAPVRCNVDGNLIKQALLNLMINAAQAMPEGGEMLIKVGADRRKALVEVIDTGVGIPPADLPKVFSVYFTTKKGGTGLGLPTTRRIIREHDGAIRVESEVGKGTRFVIELPVAKSQER